MTLFADDRIKVLLLIDGVVTVGSCTTGLTIFTTLSIASALRLFTG